MSQGHGPNVAMDGHIPPRVGYRSAELSYFRKPKPVKARTVFREFLKSLQHPSHAS